MLCDARTVRHARTRLGAAAIGRPAQNAVLRAARGGRTHGAEGVREQTCILFLYLGRPWRVISRRESAWPLGQGEGQQPSERATGKRESVYNIRRAKPCGYFALLDSFPFLSFLVCQLDNCAWLLLNKEAGS